MQITNSNSVVEVSNLMQLAVVGDFVNDLYQGQGIYRWKNGSRYEGGFFANDRHGFGTFYYSTGTARKQLWDYGDFVR